MSIKLIENRFATYRVRDRTALDKKRWWVVERWSRNTTQWVHVSKHMTRKDAIWRAESGLVESQKYEEARRG